MGRKEEIREGMSWILAEIYQRGKNHSTINYKDYSGQILEYLHENDVVIRVDKDLPPQVLRCANKTMLELAGYVAVEPLGG